MYMRRSRPSTLFADGNALPILPALLDATLFHVMVGPISSTPATPDAQFGVIYV